jgi:hypothetical protein
LARVNISSWPNPNGLEKGRAPAGNGFKPNTWSEDLIDVALDAAANFWSECLADVAIVDFSLPLIAEHNCVE